MKRSIALLTVSVFCFSYASGSGQIAWAAVAEPAGIQTAGDDTSRNRELLEIWKEHVRTLTSERDEVARQLEELKTKVNAGMAEPDAEVFDQTRQELENAKTKVAQLQSRVNTLQAENSDLRSQSQSAVSLATAATSGDENAYRESLKKMQAKIDAFEAANGLAKKEILDIKNDKDILIRDKEKALAEADQLRQQMTALKTSAPVVSQTRESSGVADETFRNLRKAYEVTKEQLASTQERQAELEATVDTLKSDTERLEKENRSLKSSRTGGASAVSDAGDFGAENQRLKSLLESTSRGNDQKLRSLEQEKQSLSAKVAELESMLHGLKSQLTTVRSQNQELRSKVDQPQPAPAVPQSSQALEQLRQQNGRYQTQMNDMRSEALRVQNRLRALESENETLRAAQGDAAGAEAQLTSLGREKLALEQSLAQARADLGQLQAKTASLESDNSRLSSSQNQNQESARSLMEKLSSVRSQIEQVSAEKDRLAREKESWLAEKNQLMAQKESLAQSLSAVGAEKDRLAAEKTRLAGQSEQWVTERSQLLDQKNQLSAQRDRWMSEKDQLASEKSAALSQLDQMRQSYKTLQAGYQSLSVESQKSKDLEMDLARLKAENDSLMKLQSQMKENSRAQEEKAASLMKNEESSLKEIASLKQQIALLEKDKLKIAERLNEIDVLKGENQSLKDSGRDLEESIRSWKQKYETSSSEASELDLASQENRRQLEFKSKQIEDLQARLAASLADVQNLKSNMGAYLDSLIADFEKRSGVVAAASPATDKTA